MLDHHGFNLLSSGIRPQIQFFATIFSNGFPQVYLYVVLYTIPAELTSSALTLCLLLTFNNNDINLHSISYEVNMMIMCMYRTMSVTLILISFVVYKAGAGQIVTDDTREWARKAVAEEKTIEAKPEGNTVAVLYYRNTTGRQELDPLRKGIALMLITDLSAVKNLQVVERVKLQALVEELGLGKSGLVEESTAPRIGKLLSARWIDGGDITGDPTKLLVQSRIADLTTGKGLAEQPESSGTLDELFRIEKDLVFATINLLNVEVTPEETAKLKKPCSTNTAALLALFKGVNAGDYGDYEQAAQQYREALAHDPKICIAADALNEVDKLRNRSARNRSRQLLQSLRDETSLTNQLTPKEELRNVRTPKDVPGDVKVDVNFPSGAR